MLEKDKLVGESQRYDTMCLKGSVGLPLGIAAATLPVEVASLPVHEGVEVIRQLREGWTPKPNELLEKYPQYVCKQS